MHIAQLNIGRLRAPIDDPLIDGFRTNLERINALAEASPGFVWRLQDEAGDATGIKVFEDELEIINLTVWTSIDALADFAYRSGHREILRRRREFFEPPSQPILCLWWIPEGTLPTPAEAVARLEHLREHGPTPVAFTFRHRFEPGVAGEGQTGGVRPLAVHHVSINVDDVDAALGFYTEVLGLAARGDRPDFPFGGAWLDAGGQQVHLIEGTPPSPVGQHFALQVEDLAATVAELRGRGIDVSDARPVGTSLQAFLNDPSGNMVELHQVAVVPA